MREDAGLSERWKETWKNYAATMAVILIGLAYCHYKALYSALHIRWGVLEFSLGIEEVLLALTVTYAIALVPYYYFLPEITSKGRIVFSYVQERINGRPAAFGMREKHAALTLAVKLFFLPLMLNWMVGDTGNLMLQLQPFRPTRVIPAVEWWHFFVLHILFVIDVSIFTVGYMVELPALKNLIKTAEPTLLGWTVCLACYPPFNGWVQLLFPWPSSDFPRFEHPLAQALASAGILAAMGIYVWASIAMGWKASNLTNRGTVAHGPYRWLRHPAYAGKNFAWWVGAVPAFSAAFSRSWIDGLYAVSCMAVFTALYAARGLTEERHLARYDADYPEYQRRTPYRFIPGLW